MCDKCIVCGKEKPNGNKYYCSKKCMGLGKQGYKKCVVCGKEFKESNKSPVVCCSHKCSHIHRQQMHENGIYDDSIQKMRIGFSEKIEAIGAENHWIAKYWEIQSPCGEIYECKNLMHFIKTHPDLFDGTAKQAYDGFQKIKATITGSRKRNPSRSWKGWTLISFS